METKIKGTPLIKGKNDAASLCKRCNEASATQQVRSECVCRTCFSQYITTKAVKRIETYKMRGSTANPRKLLFPLSFGPSSASLLQILDQHLQSQYDRMNRAAYELLVVHVDQYVDIEDSKRSRELLAKYSARFPRHTFLSIGLDQALALNDIDWKRLKVPEPSDMDIRKPRPGSLRQLIGSVKSPTSRAHIVSTLLIRLLVNVATSNNCDGILFGDSTTRLAEKVLTETAKGRGFSLPWQVADGISPYGVVFNYPARDLLRKELVTFTSTTSPPLTELVIYEEFSSTKFVSSQSTTIDDLMSQYFNSVEENYPSVVANVVKTSSKLKPPTETGSSCCVLCGLPVAEGTDGTSGWGGNQNPVSRPVGECDSHESNMCYGCARSIHG